MFAVADGMRCEPYIVLVENSKSSSMLVLVLVPSGRKYFHFSFLRDAQAARQEGSKPLP